MAIKAFKRNLLVVVPLLIWGSNANFVYAYPKTDADFAKLPEYCSARMNRTGPASQKRWKRIMGQSGWLHLHHYCAALNSINRANLGTRADRIEDSLERALHSINGVLETTGKSFVLRPELHLNKGKVLVRLKRFGDALFEFKKAISIKPDYIPAYSALSDLYVKTGDRENAVRILKTGLEKKPNSRSLKRRLGKLSE